MPASVHPRNSIAGPFAIASVAQADAPTSEPPARTARPPFASIMVPPAMKDDADPTLAGRVWTWQSSELRGERIVPDVPERYTIEFQPDGRVQARADCNRGGAGYTAGSDRSLSITPVAT